MTHCQLLLRLQLLPDGVLAAAAATLLRTGPQSPVPMCSLPCNTNCLAVPTTTSILVQTPTWCCAQVQQGLAVCQEAILAIELDELEGGTGAEAVCFSGQGGGGDTSLVVCGVMVVSRWRGRVCVGARWRSEVVSAVVVCEER